MTTYIDMPKNIFSFVIPPEAYPGRVGLLLTTLLVLINSFNNVMANTPAGDGVLNRVQRWIILCICFVKLSVLIYAMVLCQMTLFKGKFKVSPPNRAMLDNIGLIFIPLTFMIFLIVYVIQV